MPPATISNLTERRVPQVLAFYLGAAFALIEFIDFVGSRYLLPQVWTDLALLSLALLLPTVLLFTYHHGRPGRDEWHRSEKVFIPLNLLLLVVLVTMVGAGTPLAPTSKRVTVTDEEGNAREVVVANKAYRKRVAMFMFDTPDDPALKWLQLGLPEMAREDLQQSNFIEVMPSIYMRNGLEKVGYAKGVNVPLSLKRDVVKELHVPHFVTGRLEKSGSEFVATVHIYESESAKLVKERTYRAADPTQLADQISAGLLKDLNIPVLTDAKPDMPVAEILSTNPAALKAYMEATGAIYLDMDWPGALAKTEEAVRLDPTFANAHFLHFVLARYANQSAVAMSAVKAALDHSYRLPDRVKEIVKANYYIAKEDWQRVYGVLEMLEQLYPDDIQVQQMLLQIHALRDNKDALIKALKKVLELDPSRSELLLQLGGVYEARGDSKQALTYFEQYTTRHPTDPSGPRQIGNMHRSLGNHARARAAFDRALLIKPEDVEALYGLARVSIATGDFAGAEQKLQDALAAARTPPERVQVHISFSRMHLFRGEIRASIKSMEQALAELSKFAPALGQLQARLELLGLWARIDAATAARKLNDIREQFSMPPASMFVPQAEVAYYVEVGDADQAQQAMERLDAVIKQASFNFLASNAAEGKGRIADLRGNCEEAINRFREAAQLDPTDQTIGTHIGRCLRKLNRTKEAEAELRKTLRIMPAHGETNLELGLLYRAAGDATKARTHLQLALQTWQNADAAFKPLQQLREASGN